jgi:hypothetical protein
VEASERETRRGGVNLMEDPPEQQGMYLGLRPGHWPVYGDQADTVAWPHWSVAVRMSRRLPRPGLLRGSFIGRYAASSAHSSACVPPMPRYPHHAPQLQASLA